MAHYLVTAKPKPGRIDELKNNLQDHAYIDLKPFGKAMTRSLEHARLRDDGYAVWEEEDYCSPPLAAERAAALDEFFEDLSVQSVSKGAGWKQIEDFPMLFPGLEKRP